MTTIKSKTPRPTGTDAIDKTRWATSVKNTARALELGMKTLASLMDPKTTAPSGLVAASQQTIRHGVEMLTTLLEKRFDVTLSKSEIGMLDVAQRALGRADSAFYKMEKAIDATRIPPNAANYPSEWFGTVDTAASKLVSAANASGRPQYVDFNGTNLIALPGQTATAVVNDWRDATHGSQNPLAGLKYQVEMRGQDEATRVELEKLAKTEPRSLSAVLGGLQQLIDKGTYKSAFVAGLCELKHPKEIGAFVAHFLENPERVGGVSIEEARKTMVANVRFWVNERGGAAQGTERSWNDALDSALKARAAGAAAKSESVNPKQASGARDIQAVLGDLQKMVDGKRYGHLFMAGLCELRNPTEIRAFVEHYYKNPDRADAQTPLAEAREIMMKNLQFWVGPRDGAQPGTERTWLKALDEVKKANEPLKLEFLGGSHIDEVVREMIETANQKGRPVTGEFNGTKLTANPGDDAATVKQPFTAAVAESQKRHAEAMAREAEARQARVDDFKKRGGVIIETPPKDMAFDSRGLIPPNGLYNATSRPLQLITEAQLEKLPEGTQLTSISGRTAIKGVDTIDNDTRGGFIAFGFPQ